MDSDFVVKNFAGFRVFENTVDQWSTINNIRVSFTDDSKAKYIKAIDPATSRHKSFIWYDLVRKEFFDLYLGVKISSAFPLADFSDMANSQDYILIGFRLNAYLTLLTDLGLNMAFEYQSFQSGLKSGLILIHSYC